MRPYSNADTHVAGVSWLNSQQLWVQRRRWQRVPRPAKSIFEKIHIRGPARAVSLKWNAAPPRASVGDLRLVAGCTSLGQIAQTERVPYVDERCLRMSVTRPVNVMSLRFVARDPHERRNTDGTRTHEQTAHAELAGRTPPSVGTEPRNVDSAARRGGGGVLSPAGAGVRRRQRRPHARDARRPSHGNARTRNSVEFGGGRAGRGCPNKITVVMLPPPDGPRYPWTEYTARGVFVAALARAADCVTVPPPKPPPRPGVGDGGMVHTRSSMQWCALLAGETVSFVYAERPIRPEKARCSLGGGPTTSPPPRDRKDIRYNAPRRIVLH